VSEIEGSRLTLNRQLEEHKARSRSKLPPEVVAVMQKATSELVSSGIPDSCLKEGSEAPEFALRNARGRRVSLSEVLASGPVVVAFYRGGW